MMTKHITGTRKEWLDKRLELLQVAHHTYSAYIRGLDSLCGMYQWLDRAPKARVSRARSVAL